MSYCCTPCFITKFSPSIYVHCKDACFSLCCPFNCPLNSIFFFFFLFFLFFFLDKKETKNQEKTILSPHKLCSAKAPRKRGLPTPGVFSGLRSFLILLIFQKSASQIHLTFSSFFVNLQSHCFPKSGFSPIRWPCKFS